MNHKFSTINKLIQIVFLAIMMSSCSNNLMIENDSISSNTKIRIIEKRAIKKIKFDSDLYCTSAKSEKVILAELESLRSNLTDWNSKTIMSKAQMKSIFRETVMNLNKFSKLDNNNIQTDEREWIWSELEEIGTILGFIDLGEYVDEWREW